MADVFPGPLHGDPDELAADGALYSEASDAIAEAIAAIRRLGTGDFSSHAVTALDRSQGDVVEKITRIQYRYWTAGGAISAYAGALREAQRDAARAVAAHGAAAEQVTLLEHRQQEAAQLAAQPGPDQLLHIQDLQQLTMQLQEGQAQQADAQRQWAEAKAAKDAAARTARIAIHVGDEKNDLNDDLWDSIATVIPVLLIIDEIAQQVLKIVSLILTVLAIVFAVLSLILPILSPVAAALFGYAMLANLAVAALALLEFFLDGFHLMDLVLVGVAIAASFGSGLAGSALGEFVDAAIEESMSGISDAAGDALGAIAKNAVTEGVKDLTKEALGDLLFDGDSEAQALYDQMGPFGTDLLNTELSDTVDDWKAEGKLLGGYVGADFNAGFGQLGLKDASSFLQDHLGSFVQHEGLGNLQWAKDGWNAVNDTVVNPLHSAYDQANRWVGQVRHLDPGGVFTNPDNATAWSAGDVSGDKLGDAVGGVASDWASAASHGHWGGAAQWVAHAGTSVTGLPGGQATTGAITDKLGDVFGNMQDAQHSALVSVTKQADAAPYQQYLADDAS